jgi:hypothetical protein
LLVGFIGDLQGEKPENEDYSNPEHYSGDDELAFRESIHLF